MRQQKKAIGLWGLFIKIEIKEQFIRSLFTGKDNETIGFFGNKRWISREGEIINHIKEAFNNFFTTTSEDKHLDFSKVRKQGMHR